MTPRAQAASLFWGYGAAGIFWGAFAAATPALQTRTGLDTGAFGLLLGAMTLAALPAMRLSGHLTATRPAMAIPAALATFTLGAAILATIPGVVAVLVALPILGASSGALDVALNARTARLEADGATRLFNRTHALFPAAMLIASVATGAARQAGAGLGPIFAVVALALGSAALFERRAGRHQTATAPTDETQSARLTLAVALLATIAAFAAFQEMAAQAWLSIFAERALGSGPFLAGLAPGAFVAGLSLGRLGAHALDARLSARSAMALGASLAMLGFVFICLGPDPSRLPLLAFVAGLGVGPVEPAVFRAVATRKDAARSLPAVTSVAYLGYLLSPPALGAVVDLAGWPALWGVAALLAVGTGALAARSPQ